MHRHENRHDTTRHGMNCGGPWRGKKYFDKARHSKVSKWAWHDTTRSILGTGINGLGQHGTAHSTPLAFNDNWKTHVVMEAAELVLKHYIFSGWDFRLRSLALLKGPKPYKGE